MNRKRLFAYILVLLGVVALVSVVAYGSNLAVLNPKGIIAHKERNLLFFGVILSAIIVIPVFVMTFTIAWKYRAENKKARYEPEWDRSRAAETTWWLVPFALILVLSAVTWRSSHDLDPFRPIASASGAKPITIQVVAMQWKWLFIYPDQNIASVNYLQIPVNTPINFEITSDAPMNSFWVPQLGGQIYAMSGMSTHLHLLADEVGDYNGSSANISGEGFAGMRFVVRASTQNDYDSWLRQVQQAPDGLSLADYDKLAKPSENNPRALYSATAPDLYDTIVMKYMTPSRAQITATARANGDY